GIFPFKSGFDICPYFFYIHGFIKTDIITASPFEFNTLIETIKIGSDPQCKNDHRDNISVFPVFNEFEFRMFENAPGNACKIFEVFFLIGEPFRDPAAYEDTTEKGSKNTDDLRGRETFYRTQSEI